MNDVSDESQTSTRFYPIGNAIGRILSVNLSKIFYQVGHAIHRMLEASLNMIYCLEGNAIDRILVANLIWILRSLRILSFAVSRRIGKSFA